MSKIKALDELRKTLSDCIIEAGYLEKFETYWITKDAADKLLDKVEAEIEEFYMRLPLDADGIPIKVADLVEMQGHAGAVWLIGINEFMCTNRKCYSMNSCTHVKPSTLEDILRDYASDYRNTLSRFDAGESSGPSPYELVDKYAAKIRELMEG